MLLWLMLLPFSLTAAVTLRSQAASFLPPLHKRTGFLWRSRRMSAAAGATMKYDYPVARRDEVVEEFHGTKISDYYRWLEDPDSPETQAFVAAQNELSTPFIQNAPVREKILTRLREVWDYEKFGTPFKRGGKYYYYHNSGLQQQYVLYTLPSLDAPSRCAFDPNTWSEDGTIALTSLTFTDDGSKLAYGISEKGSDWTAFKVVDMESFQASGDNSTADEAQYVIDDQLKRVKYSGVSWNHDDSGLYYSNFDLDKYAKTDGTETTKNQNQKVYFHRLGTPQSEDVLLAQFDDPEWMASASETKDGRYLVLSISRSCEPTNQVWICDLEAIGRDMTKVKSSWKPVIDNFDAGYDLIGNIGPTFLWQTNKDAQRYKVIAMDIDLTAETPEGRIARQYDVIPEAENGAVLEGTSRAAPNILLCEYLQDVRNKLELFTVNDGEGSFEWVEAEKEREGREVTVKHRKTVDAGMNMMVTSSSRKDTEIFYKVTGFTEPSTIYRLDLAGLAAGGELQPSIFKQAQVKGFNSSEFETKQVFFPSLKDGTKIPMFITHKKGLKLDGSHPVLLYGYGGFSISLTPSFSPKNLIWMKELGGVYAVANIRGGAEYGLSWYHDGRLDKKQNCFDDFQSAADYLVKSGYTAPSRLASQGGSNGGLLVAACANQRPDLFGACIAQVGVMDMLRYHKFGIGGAWQSDYGCSDDPSGFASVINYSPIHNVKVPADGGSYPALLLLTGDHDDRVSPFHSLKFIATIQHHLREHAGQKQPLFAYIDTKSGHGAGKPTTKVLEEIADVFTFLTKTLEPPLTWQE
ncbi:unnamed protein product [Vitrella brassicaformis CCMP3155]|uniref:Prolyl endopeptidase n=2 Tax=Vitrella brassicaformis TaxID=1169539 RepID=A0A0G4EL30_VITBC|nr:unnamed protein product [Vitrella brassicaformis CCMP3155]|mmetsp:Transcript_18642/g.44887  ORF Transcript_18642/g.44887 Transcript_18642/m.44887 type:complete len:804 (+) Transcript_18642:55-2466(+)|eukprot:CEL97891.1 unnamed protein product [Vitrella brassicaformis CCMP3155]